MNTWSQYINILLSSNNLAYSFTVTDEEKSFYDMNTWSQLYKKCHNH
jgi:hypothetical protein